MNECKHDLKDFKQYHKPHYTTQKEGMIMTQDRWRSTPLWIALAKQMLGLLLVA